MRDGVERGWWGGSQVSELESVIPDAIALARGPKQSISE
jgi:hypothetical protein